jgi:serine protease Do
MKRMILIFALILCACTTNEIPKNTHLIHAMNATVQIFTEEGTRGTGFYIGNGYIMTAYHVVDNPDVRLFYSHNDVLHEAFLVKHHKEHDLAILKMDVPIHMPIIKISDDDPELGDRIYTLGFHFGISALKIASHGHVTGFIELEDQPEYTLFNAAINSGASGGPIVNEKGELIGINQMIYTRTGDWAGIGLSVKLDLIKKFLRN